MAIFNRGIYEGGRDEIVKRLRRKRVQARKMAVEVKCWAHGCVEWSEDGNYTGVERK